jgi:hypothetical protein
MGRWIAAAIFSAQVLGVGLFPFPAWGAEITRVASSGDKENPFDLDVEIRWDRTQRRGLITQEFSDPDSTRPFGNLDDGAELRYQQITNVITARLAVGIYKDFEFHAEVPYYIGDEHTWRYATKNGASVEPESGIANNPVDASGNPCTGCPIFNPAAKVFHGGRPGDLTVGLAYGVLNEERDDTKPTWLVGVDITMPTASRYNPTFGQSSYGTAGKPGPFGHRAWSYDLTSTMSKRYGPMEPYLSLRWKYRQRSGTTYSNCANPERLSVAASASCTNSNWKEDGLAKPPWVVGASLGAELVPYEAKLEGQRVGIDLRLNSDFTSSGRWYNELSDATGKLLYHEQYASFGALLGVYVTASKFVQLRVSGSLTHDLSHFLTNEKLGKDLGVGTPGVTPDTVEQNPNFDWRYDAPGRRFRIAEVSVFNLSASAVARF